MEITQTIKVGVLRVSDKCAAGEPDRLGAFLKAKIDSGYITDNCVVIKHSIVRKNTLEIKKAVLEMAKHCQVIFTVGWCRFRPDIPMRLTEPKIDFPPWVDEILVKRTGSYVIPRQTLFLHLRDRKHWALKGLEYVSARLASKVDDILSGRYEEPKPHQHI